MEGKEKTVMLPMFVAPLRPDGQILDFKDGEQFERTLETTSDGERVNPRALEICRDNLKVLDRLRSELRTAITTLEKIAAESVR